MTTPTSTTFTPPLPCSAIGEDGSTRCGKPATVGALYQYGGGQWLLQPFCRDCVAGMRWMYVEAERQNEERRGDFEPDSDPFEVARRQM